MADEGTVQHTVHPRSADLCRSMFEFLSSHFKEWEELADEESEFQGYSLASCRTPQGKSVKLDFRCGFGSEHELHYIRTVACWVTLKIGRLYPVRVRGEILQFPALFCEGERWPLVLEGQWQGKSTPDDQGFGMLVNDLGFQSKFSQLESQLARHVASIRDTRGTQKVLEAKKAAEGLILGEVRRLESLWVLP